MLKNGNRLKLNIIGLLLCYLLEKWIHNKTQDYLQRNELKYNYKCCFRANHYTDARLSQLTDTILSDVTNGKHRVMILIDLQKLISFWHHRSFIGFSVISLLSHKQSFFRFIRLCLFGSRDHKYHEFPKDLYWDLCFFAIHKWCSPGFAK